MSRSQSRVSSLVMIASRGKWCSGPAAFFDIHTLWNKNDCKYTKYTVLLMQQAEPCIKSIEIALVGMGDGVDILIIYPSIVVNF